MWQDLEAISCSQSQTDGQNSQETLCHASKVDLPSVGVYDIFGDEMYGSLGSDLRSVHLSKVSVVAAAKHLGTRLDASIVHEFVENLSCLLVEFASSAVTLDGRLDTSETWLVFI